MNIDIRNIDIILSSLDDKNEVRNANLECCEINVLLKTARLQKFPEQSCLELELF